MNLSQIEKDKLDLKRCQMLNQLTEEMASLENKIQDSRKKNKTQKRKRVTRIALRTGQLIAPYAIIVSLLTGICSFCGHNPFKLNSNREKARFEKETDSLGNIKITKQYRDFSSVYPKVFFYSKWQKQDGRYIREVRVFEAKDLTEEKIEEIIKQYNNGDYSFAEEMLKESLVKQEIRNNLTEEEINKDAYLASLIYLEDKDDYILVKESIGDHISFDVIFILAAILISCLVFSIRKFKFRKSISEIKEKYPEIDVQTLQRELKIKKDNYSRLMR